MCSPRFLPDDVGLITVLDLLGSIVRVATRLYDYYHGNRASFIVHLPLVRPLCYDRRTANTGEL
jgi:hypothetical protein